MHLLSFCQGLAKMENKYPKLRGNIREENKMFLQDKASDFRENFTIFSLSLRASTSVLNIH